MLITASNLCKSFGDEVILKDIKMTIHDHGRYGLIGVNGAGKSTLLKILIGELNYDSGELYKKPDLTLGYLAQNSGLERDCTIIEEMRKAFSDVLQAEADMRRLEAEMAEISDHESAEYRRISASYSHKMSYIDSRDGYNMDVKIKTILQGMGFGDRDMNTVISTLSGGEKTRLAMAKLLLEEPELLILDEPTNHLDFRTLRWLEEYLTTYKGAILAVSHDRYFLDKTVNHIYEVRRGKLHSFVGNYSKYLVEKEARLIREKKEYEMQQAEIARMQEYIDKNMARASTSNSAKSRQKALDNMEILDAPESELKTMRLKFEHTKDPYKDVLKTENLDIAVGNPPTVICQNINLDIKRGEKIALIGDNGIGKSSLLKTVLGLIPAGGGSFEWGKNVSLSYYEQENLNLDPEKIALDELWDRFPTTPEAEIRRVLGNVLLTKEDVFKPVKVISGGERAKLAFCIIMLEKSNVLIMDEPTNHLDLASKEILEKAMSDFGGTIIFVSHDRYLLNKVPDKIIEITRTGADRYDGNYDYLCEVQERRAREKAQAVAEAAAKAAELNKKSSTEGGHRSKEQRRADAQRKNRIRELEGLIEEAEARISALEAEMATEEVFSDYKLMNEKCTEADTLRTNLDEYLTEWAELSE